MKIPDNNKPQIAERLRMERKTAGMTQADLAKRVGCTHQSIFEIERAGSFSVGLLREVAAALGLSEQWLRTGSGEKSSARVLQATHKLSREMTRAYPSGGSAARLEKQVLLGIRIRVEQFRVAGKDLRERYMKEIMEELQRYHEFVEKRSTRVRQRLLELARAEYGIEEKKIDRK